jgi:MSHA biogenesis protein MshL
LPGAINNSKEYFGAMAMPLKNNSINFGNLGKLVPAQLTLLAMVLSALGCASPRDKPMAVESEMDKVVAEQAARDKQLTQASMQNVPVEVTQALLDNNAAKTTSGIKTNERFDVSVRGVPAKEFFLGLVNGTGINVVVHPEVTGSISLDLKDVTIDDVLRVTRDIYGFEFKQDHGIYTVYANALRTEVFHINYLDVQRVGVSDTSVLIGSAQSNNNSNNNGGGNNNSGNSGQNNSGGGSDSTNLLSMLDSAEKNKSNSNSATISPGSRVQTLNKTDFWSSLHATIVSIVGGVNEKRTVTVSPQAGMVVVQALPSELSAVREFLERSELSVKRQVILEAKILEVRLSEGFEAGVNWGAISGALQQNNFKDTSYGSVNKIPLDNIVEAGKAVSSVLAVQDISKLLSLLETQGAVQVLSSPRVSTVNNQKAVIRVGSDEYFVTGISSNTTSNATTISSTPNIELSSFFSGISLDVTPQISEDGEVILHIHPVVSDVSDQQKEFTVGDQNFSLPLALRGIRESDSIVKAGSGQVIVLGGLMQESKSNTDGKRPYLGDVPILNTLFRTKAKAKLKTELVILLRPIVVDDNAWKDQLKDSQNRINNIGEAYRKQ